MTKLREVKIRTYSNEALSAAIQEQAFRLGCSWPEGVTVAKYLLEPYLFIDDAGILFYGFLDSAFDDRPYREITLDELFAMEPHDPEDDVLEIQAGTIQEIQAYEVADRTHLQGSRRYLRRLHERLGEAIND